MASLTRSCLLNLAFAEAKSKSVSGTSTLGAGLRAPPLPPRPLLANPAFWLPGCLGARTGSFTLISLTFLVRLSIPLPFICPPVGSFAIAAATAAVAACVASLKLAAGSTGLAVGTEAFAAGLCKGKAGMTRPLFFGPSGAALDTAALAAA